MTPAGRVVAVMPSLPPRPLMTSVSFAPSDAGDVRPAPDRPSTGHRGSGAEHVDDVVAVGAVDDHASAAASPAVPPIVPARLTFTFVTSVPDRSLTVMVSVPPSALRSIVSTSFEVHHDVAEVAGEAHAAAVRRRPSKISLPALPLNSMRVGAVLALDDVAAVARIPLEHVVAGAEERECRCPAGRR